jgi:hypothetical protein
VLQAVTDAVLKATKLTRAELLKEVAGGKTLAEVVKAKGGDVDAVKKEAKAAIEAAIKKDVTDGRIKQEQADAFLKNLDQSLDRALNSTLPGAGARNAVDPRVRQVELNVAETATIEHLTTRSAPATTRWKDIGASRQGEQRRTGEDRHCGD